jgi:site-specific recombinase XerD
MDVQKWLTLFEQKLIIQRYSQATIANYKGCVAQFLTLASKKFAQPQDISVSDIEKYVFWLFGHSLLVFALCQNGSAAP